MRIFAIGLTALLLGGCYESTNLLLSPTVARQPVQSAMDWKYTAAGDTYHARLKPREDGWYDFEQAPVAKDGSEGSWEHHTALMNYLETVDGGDVFIFAMWSNQENAYMYGLAVMRPDVNWRLVIPNCDRFTARGAFYQSDYDAAVKATNGARSPKRYGCFFNSPADLRQAMRSVVHAPEFWDRVLKQTG